jgi:hypothetical protein
LKYLLLVTFILSGQLLFGQMPNVFKNKWGFIGNGILFFSERDGKSFVELMEQETYSFSDLYTKGESKDTRFQDEMKVIDTVKNYQLQGVIKLYTAFGRKLDTVNFVIEKSKRNILKVVKKFVPDYRTINMIPNPVCDTTFFACPVYLYDIAVFEQLKKLKEIEKITKPDMEKFLKKLEMSFSKSCNLCNESFFVAEINKIVIELGYNPVSSRTTQYATYYKTSALYHISFLLATEFKELKLKYEKLLNRFYFGK